MEECKITGYKKILAPVINRFDDGMKPFGDGAGHPYTSEPRGDADGMEEIPVYECVEGCPVKVLDKQSGEGSDCDHQGQGPDTGGASRFFGQFQPDAPFLYCGKVSRKERNEGLKLALWSHLRGEPVENTHPTMKPLALMEWLVKLVTPKDAVVLDPYCGTGTTCVAALACGCKYIGIEKDEGFHGIAVRRMEGLRPKLETRADDERQRENFELMFELEQDD